MSRIRRICFIPICVLTLFALSSCTVNEESPRPNILWIDIDDQTPWYGTYGDDLVATPNLDALADEGVVFERAYAANPVCGPSRSAFATGYYPIRLGTHDMRSGRTLGYQIHLPEGIKPIPEMVRNAGYETYNSHKDDYNFTYDRTDLYSFGNPSAEVLEAAKNDRWGKGLRGTGHWSEVPEGLPLFGQMSIAGGKGVANIEEELRALGVEPVGPADVRVPAQYPDIPQVRQHIADHYNSIARTDHQVGEVIQQLKDDGLWGNTVVILYSDHGSDLPRSKEFVYHEGLHVPLIITGPGFVEPDRRGDIVNLMDIGATTLALAGIDVPENMDAKDLFAPDYDREYVYSSADRMSNVIDRTRSVMGERFHYIRNFMLDRPLFNWGHREMVASMQDPQGETTSFMAMRRMYEAGELEGVHAAPYGERVPEELYDLHSDPDEVVNLAGDPEYADQLAKMRGLLDAWIEDTDDKGQYPRSAAALKEVIDRMPPDWLKSPEYATYVGDTESESGKARVADKVEEALAPAKAMTGKNETGKKE